MKGIMEQRNFMSKSSSFIEYMKLHLISLNQDFDGKYNTETKIHIQGQIDATRHLLSVATDIMNNNERTYV
jgi:hypothetical protein